MKGDAVNHSGIWTQNIALRLWEHYKDWTQRRQKHRRPEYAFSRCVDRKMRLEATCVDVLGSNLLMCRCKSQWRSQAGSQWHVSYRNYRPFPTSAGTQSNYSIVSLNGLEIGRRSIAMYVSTEYGCLALTVRDFAITIDNIPCPGLETLPIITYSRVPSVLRCEFCYLVGVIWNT